MTEEEKAAQEAEVLKAKNEAQEAVKKMAKEAATEQATSLVDSKIEGMKAELNKSVQEMQARVKEMKQTSNVVEKKLTIDESLRQAIGENSDVLKSFSGYKNIALKAITNTNFDGTSLLNQTREVRTRLYESPYSPLYLRNIFPFITTDNGSITIAQIQSIAGAAAVWARGTGEGGVDVAKPDVTPSYKEVSVVLKWIAGVTHVNRELLLNVSYLQSSITNTLLYSSKGIFAAENKMITDYLADKAPAYAGSKTVVIEKLIDAAFNQLLGNYMKPTHVLMNQADYLTHIKFNKATGSGEYDLPNDELRGFTGTELETSVSIVPVPSLAAGTAYVISAPEFEFISRMTPELKVSEDSGTNFEFNKVSFRIEEMVAFIAKDLNAMVKVTL